MLVNAENLPIEGIDRIEITLNPELYIFINFKKVHLDSKNHLKLRYVIYYGLHVYLDLQAQRIDLLDIRHSIAQAIYDLIVKEVINFPIAIPLYFIYNNLDFFVSEIREIEFYFDFEPSAITIVNQEELNKCKETFYSNDRRIYDNRPARKSILEDYDRISRLIKLNQMSHKQVYENPYSQRIEFRLTKYNSPYRTLNNLSGSYYDIINRYIPYLSIIYYRFFYNNITIDTTDHPVFSLLYAQSPIGKTRYTGNLEKATCHKGTDEEKQFYYKMYNLIIAKHLFT